MSHEIMEHDKQQGRTMAWHKLTEVNPELTLENCWLGTWDYVPVKMANSPFRMLQVSDICMTAETDTDAEGNEFLTGNEYPLAIGVPYMPNSFKPLTNAKLLELLAKATEGKDLTLASAGTIKNRGRQFLSFQFGESYRAAGRDFVPFFNVGNGNDKSSPIWQNTSNECTVCNNTFELNMYCGGLIMEVKKTKFSELKIGDFAKAAKAVLAGQREFADALELLALTPCNENAAREFFAGFVGKLIAKPLSTRAANVVERYVALFKSGKGNGGANWADVFSGGTDYLTHESASGAGTNAANWKNYVSSEHGSARNEKQRLWTIVNVENQRNAVILAGKVILAETAKAARAGTQREG